jgi:curved DNA-binding protein CbpA
MVNYYLILGVTQTATNREIRAAFLAIAKQTHPDHNAGDPNKEARFKVASEAYAVLSAPDQRARHDRELALHEAATRARATNNRSQSQSGPSNRAQVPRYDSYNTSQTTPRQATVSTTQINIAPTFGLFGLVGLLVIAANAADKKRTYWDPAAKRRRARDGQFRPTKSWW